MFEVPDYNVNVQFWLSAADPLLDPATWSGKGCFSIRGTPALIPSTDPGDKPWRIIRRLLLPLTALPNVLHDGAYKVEGGASAYYYPLDCEIVSLNHQTAHVCIWVRPGGVSPPATP